MDKVLNPWKKKNLYFETLVTNKSHFPTIMVITHVLIKERSTKTEVVNM